MPPVIQPAPPTGVERRLQSAAASVLLCSRLPAVATHAQALTVGDIVSLATFGNAFDVVSMCFPLVGTDAATFLALPRITGQHGQPPGSMLLVAVSTLVSIGAVIGAALPYSWWPKALDA